jgi:hypothetical protein
MKRLLLILAMAMTTHADPVVLELFTSQGCSSCPSADEFLRKLAKDKRVIPLAFHVDYWNYLGWRDPFSSRDWSQRQSDYVRAMKLSGAYTPQLVINGSRQMVGSSAFEIYRAIDEEAKRKSDARVTISPDGVIRAQTKAPAELILITYENGVVTKITRGENAGRTQTNDSIVRKLERLGIVTGTAEKRVALAKNVVAILQDPKTMRITAAASLP